MLIVPAISAGSLGPPNPLYITSVGVVNGDTVTAPASVNAGDLLVLLDYALNSTAIPTNVVPTGFTSIGGTSGSVAATWDIRVSASYKICNGSEGSAVITGMNDTQERKLLIQYRSNKSPITSLSASSVIASSVLDTDPPQQTLTASGGVAPVIGITMFLSNASVNTRVTSITPDHDLTMGDNVAYVQDYIQEAEPANYTWDMADLGSPNTLVGFYLHNFQ